VSEPAELLAALERDGLVHRVSGRYRTTRGFESTMERAASRLSREGELGGDLRAPISSALLEIYGDALSDEELAARMEALLPIEDEELDPRIEVVLDDSVRYVLDGT